MKPLKIYFLFLSLLLSSCLIAQQKTKEKPASCIGIKFGPNASDFIHGRDFGPGRQNNRTSISFTGGIYANLWKLQPGLYFVQKGAKTDFGADDTRFITNYVEFDLPARFKAGKWSALIGPYVAKLLPKVGNHSPFQPPLTWTAASLLDARSDWHYNTTDWGGVFAGEVAADDHFAFGITARLGYRSVMKNDWMLLHGLQNRSVAFQMSILF